MPLHVCPITTLLDTFHISDKRAEERVQPLKAGLSTKTPNVNDTDDLSVHVFKSVCILISNLVRLNIDTQII